METETNDNPNRFEQQEKLIDHARKQAEQAAALPGDRDVGPPDGSKKVVRVPVPTSIPLPEDFGDYEFIKPLGKGAFGVVFKVWSKSKCCHEAMKVLVGPPKSERIEDFQRELQKMANVPGPHFAHVHHASTLPDGRPFFTMEYLNGGRIDDFCNRTRKTIADRILAVADICDAVHKMHELKLVHCDIKPGNIVVHEDTDTAIPKLVDFGLARLLAFQPSPTRTAGGTLPYMPPEQLESRGGVAEKRWDIYALGVTLYQLLVGELPIDNFPDPSLPPEVHANYVRKTRVPTLVEKLPWDSVERSDEIARERKLSPETLHARLRDRWLEAIVGKALAKDRDDRYASAADMGRNLRVYAAGRRPPIVPPTPQDRAKEFLRDHWFAVTSATTLVIFAALFLWGYRAKAAALQDRVDKLIHQGCGATDPSSAIEAYEQALKLDPTRSDILLHLAGAHVTDGNAELAVNVAEAIAKGDPSFGHAQAFISGINQFRARLNENDVPEVEVKVSPGEEYYYALALGANKADLAIDMLDQALKGHPPREERFRIRLVRATRYYQTGDFDKASSEAQWLVEDLPESAAAWNLLGMSESRAGRNEDALKAYNLALKHNHEYAAVYRNRADLNCELENYAAALKDCEQAVRLDPSLSPNVLGVRIDALMGLRDFAKARTECEALEHESVVTGQTHVACGTLWMELKLPARAWADFNLAVEKRDPYRPFDHESRYRAIGWRGLAALQSKRYRDAIADFNEYEASPPGPWRQDENNFFWRGLAFLLVKEPENAVADLNRAAELTKSARDRSHVHLWLWYVHLASGRTEEAKQALRQAAQAAKNDEWMTRIVGHCDETVERETLLKDAAGVSYKEAAAHYYLGLAAKARGDENDARDCFETCLQYGATGNMELQLLADMQLSLLRAKP